MSIRPIDFQQMAPKSQEATQIKANEHNKLAASQNQLHSQFNSNIKHNSQQITKPQESEYTPFRYDAKEKGNGQYSDSKKKKKKDEDDKKDKQLNNKHTEKSISSFDAKI